MSTELDLGRTGDESVKAGLKAADTYPMGVPALKPKSSLQVERKDMGRADSFRYNILTHVADENYDRAIHDLKNFMSRETEFLKAKIRSERFVLHCIDLVNAIRAKRRFPGMNSLTIAKQQELNDRFREHFNELQYILKKIEKIEHEVRLEDVRSTVWVVKALAGAIGVVLALGFLIDVNAGLLRTTIFVIDDGFFRFTRWMLGLVGF